MSEIDLRRRNFFKTSMGAAAVAIAPGILLFDAAHGKPPAGDGKVRWNAPPVTGSEDFAFMLDEVPGCYFFIGNGEGDGVGACSVHNPGYDFNDRNIGVGAAMWVALAQRFLQASA